ncbi:hypothetical protein APSETT445_002167 [Aspergillus pseudonomiae]
MRALIILVFFGALATYTGYVIGQFKWRYPHISNMADAGEVLAGKFGRELLGITQTLFLVFIMASHILTILSAVIITMIGVGILAPGAGSMQVTVKTDLVHGFTSVTNIVFAFAGHAAFFGFAAELKDPRDFPKALCLLQSIDISLYIIAAVVIYRYAGVDVASPALGSASPVVSKVAYGIALPTIIIAGVINGHIAFKYIYIRIFRGTDRMHKRDWVAVSSWVGIAASLWILAWIIAEAIPVFSNLLGLITALFASWFTFGLSGMFWLHMNKGLWFSSPKKILLTLVNLMAIVVAATLLMDTQCGLGLYVSGKAIHDDPSSASFSCANNA